MIQLHIVVEFLILMTLSYNRYYVLYKLPKLTFLDSRTVSSAERSEARRKGEFTRVVKPTSHVVCIIMLTVLLCTVQPLTKDMFGTSHLSFVERLSSFRGDFSIECVYKGTFGLSFVVLFRNVLYQRFHCIIY